MKRLTVILAIGFILCFTAKSEAHGWGRGWGWRGGCGRPCVRVCVPRPVIVAPIWVPGYWGWDRCHRRYWYPGYWR